MSEDLFFIEKDLKFPTLAELIAKYQQEKLPVLAAQLLYPLVTPQNFERVYSSRLFDEARASKFQDIVFILSYCL